MTRCRCEVILMMVLLSHADNGVAGAIWPLRDIYAKSCWQRRCRVMLAMMLPRQLGHDAISMPSLVGDGAAQSCKQWHCNSRLY
jgi:hypothetical protein